MRASGRSKPANICLILSSQARLSSMPFSVNERCRRPPPSRGRCTVIVVARRGDERLRIAGGPARPVRAPDRRQARGPRRSGTGAGRRGGAGAGGSRCFGGGRGRCCFRRAGRGRRPAAAAVKPAATAAGLFASPITGALTGSVADAAAATAAASFCGFWRSTRKKSSTRRAIGPAACAPQPPFSTTSATAICGWSTGAYAMNSAWSRRCSASRWPL